ncbi:unnamed protein product [Phaeothamnion confervicola]
MSASREANCIAMLCRQMRAKGEKTEKEVSSKDCRWADSPVRRGISGSTEQRRPTSPTVPPSTDRGSRLEEILEDLRRVRIGEDEREDEDGDNISNFGGGGGGGADGDYGGNDPLRYLHRPHQWSDPAIAKPPRLPSLSSPRRGGDGVAALLAGFVLAEADTPHSARSEGPQGHWSREAWKDTAASFRWPRAAAAATTAPGLTVAGTAYASSQLALSPEASCGGKSTAATNRRFFDSPSSPKFAPANGFRGAAASDGEALGGGYQSQIATIIAALAAEETAAITGEFTNGRDSGAARTAASAAAESLSTPADEAATMPCRWADLLRRPGTPVAAAGAVRYGTTRSASGRSIETEDNLERQRRGQRQAHAVASPSGSRSQSPGLDLRSATRLSEPRPSSSRSAGDIAVADASSAAASGAATATAIGAAVVEAGARTARAAAGEAAAGRAAGGPAGMTAAAEAAAGAGRPMPPLVELVRVLHRKVRARQILAARLEVARQAKAAQELRFASTPLCKNCGVT